MAPEDEDRSGLRVVFYPVLDHSLELLIAFERDKESIRIALSNDFFGPSVLGPLDVVKAFEIRKGPVLKKGGACLAKAQVEVYLRMFSHKKPQRNALQGLWLVPFPVHSDIFSQLTLSIMAPTGRMRQIGEPVLHRQSFPQGCPEHSAPLMKGDAQWIEGFDVLCQPIDRGVVGYLRFECAEHPIPNDEDTGMVSIQIPWIGGVVYAMMGRGIEYPFEPFRQFVYGLRVNPELVEQ